MGESLADSRIGRRLGLSHSIRTKRGSHREFCETMSGYLIKRSEDPHIATVREWVGSLGPGLAPIPRSGVCVRTSFSRAGWITDRSRKHVETQHLGIVNVIRSLLFGD